MLPSGLARVRSCCWCPSNWPLRRKPLPVTGPCLRTRLPYWTDPGARETDGHHPSDWKTAGRQNPAGIRNCANGFDLSARRHLFAQSMACSRLFWPDPGSWALHRTVWCSRWAWRDSAASPGSSRFSAGPGHFPRTGFCSNSRRDPWSLLRSWWKSCSSLVLLSRFHLCLRLRYLHRCRKNLLRARKTI